MTDENESVGAVAEAYRDAQLARVPTAYKRNDERMALELCLLKDHEDPLSVFQRYGYEREQALEMLESPAFIRLLEAAKKDIAENGVGFRMKARAQAEDLLAESFAIATDPLASAAVRADLIKWTAKVAGYEPKDKDDKGGGSGGLTLNITFAGQAQQAVVTREPLTIEHGANNG